MNKLQAASTTGSSSARRGFPHCTRLMRSSSSINEVPFNSGASTSTLTPALARA